MKSGLHLSPRISTAIFNASPFELERIPFRRHAVESIKCNREATTEMLATISTISYPFSLPPTISPMDLFVTEIDILKFSSATGMGMDEF
jgi:hypothetical protein